MNVLSLFSGIGGLEYGLEQAGLKTVGQVEMNPFCRQVLDKHWPEVPKHDDVRTAVDWWRSTVRPPVDVVAGGFPCQPFSEAGRRQGIADERWGWPWMFDVIAALRPRHVVCENVEALLRDSDAMAIILGDFASLGFDVEWVVRACSVGAPHARNRVFIVAYAAGDDVADQGALLGQARGLRPEPGGGGGVAAGSRGGWLPEPAVDRVADGVPASMVRAPLSALGNAVVPAVAEAVGRRLMMREAA